MTHHTTLHLGPSAKTCVTRATKNVLLATAQVQVKSVKGESVLLKALIDQGSQTTFISEEAVQILQLRRTKVSTELHGIGNVLLGVSKAKVELEIYPRFKSREKFKTEALILPTLSYAYPDPSLNLQEWQQYKLADPHFNKSERIDIVIGGDLFSEILQNGVYKKNGIIGQKTKLGLILSGQLQVKQPKNTKLVNMTTSIERFWELEEIPNHHERNVLHEDERCMQIFENTTTKDNENRFVVKMPFKEEKLLGDSYKKAMARFLSLEKKLEVNPDIKEQYIKFLDEYISLGHMIKVPNHKNGKYYLPHQPVVRETSSTTKLRVVFDASSKTSNGKSLNDILYIGPRLQKDVFDILIKFRLHKFAIIADVEKMYRQIKVHEEDQQYQHILWRKSKEKPIQEYKLTTVTYGTASAPFLAVRSLFEIANECENEVLKDIIKQDFYMDDLLTGAGTIQECKSIKESVSEQLNKYGFHLRKWCSNSEDIIKQQQYTEKNEVIDIQQTDKIKTLGMSWNPSEDLFSFKINSNHKMKITKRIALSYLAKIFDPIGVLTPITVTAKLFIQQLWMLKINWDDDLNDVLQTEWNKVVKNLHTVEEIKISRWVNTMPLDNIQLLGFADASEKAYAAVIYIKSCGIISLLTAKSKVNPIKNRKTLPKLELCAAQLLVKLCSKVKEIINKDIEVHLWSDSMIVLAWIKNNKNKDKFVRSRVSEITTTIPNAEWRYVASKDNPADLGSRGISSEKLCKSKLWWYGPEWLQKSEDQWPKELGVTVTSTTTNIVQKNEMSEILNKYSSFRKLRRVLAYVLRFVRKLKGIKNLPKYLTADEIQNAEILIIKIHQNEEWFMELTDLQNKKQLNHRHKLANLSPYVDENGIMRVGGRLHFSNLTQNKKHPILIQKSSLAYQIISDAHTETFHGGNRLVESAVKRKFWIINAKACIKKVIRNCAICVRYKQNTKQQLMGNLPEYRVNFSAPFDHCGVDYAGPLQIKFSNGRGQRAYKGYVAVFICMATKAVHLEAVSSLTSEAFLAALKRFFARRGKSSHMYSDNGSNFVGASRLLDKEFQRAIQQNSSVAPILEEDQIRWHFIPAASPHFGGIWEAAVKSMKHHLRRVIGETKLTFEELSTLLAQIEAILNSRPLQAL